MTGPSAPPAADEPLVPPSASRRRRPDPSDRVAAYELGSARVTVTLDAGPRIVGYEQEGHADLFARLPDARIEHPSIGEYRFIGGHRLWRAPETPAVTYQPDDRAVEVSYDTETLRLRGAPDTEGVVKTMALRQQSEFTIVDHTLHNMGQRRVQTSPWAITQLKLGGTAVIPAQSEAADRDGILPNRSMALWPYSDLSDPGVAIENGRVEIEARPDSAKFKLGQANTRGWLAYGLGPDLFVKWAPLHDDAGEYPDLGSSVECYRDDRFIELETLGQLSWLEPGASLGHREVWTVYSVTGPDRDELLGSLPSDPKVP